jgi:hypothetical protein
MAARQTIAKREWFQVIRYRLRMPIAPNPGHPVRLFRHTPRPTSTISAARSAHVGGKDGRQSPLYPLGHSDRTIFRVRPTAYGWLPEVSIVR